jgi:RHS repeat-associated protein
LNYPFLVGYERDNETGLDYAGARYFASAQGRFTSTDPLMASARVELPESWNRYAYCYNNPLALVDPDGMDVEILDEKAKQYLLNTLPKNIRDQVKSKIDKNGLLAKGALDKIKSKDDNFLALKEMVNDSSTTEVMSASSDRNRDFDYKSVADVRKEVYNELIKKGFSPKDARQYANDNKEPQSHLGTMLTPTESPSGNLRVIVSDGTGKAAKAPMSDLVGTMGHEMFGHGLLYVQGKPFDHVNGPPYSHFKQIEQRSKANYSGASPPQANPRLIKPRK